jgi:hypothetical protein
MDRQLSHTQFFTALLAGTVALLATMLVKQGAVSLPQIADINFTVPLAGVCAVGVALTVRDMILTMGSPEARARMAKHAEADHKRYY